MPPPFLERIAQAALAGRRLARAVELAAICESLSSGRIPEAYVPELVELLAIS